MSYSEVEEQVKDVLAEKLNKGKDTIVPNAQLVEDLGMDSFGAIEMVFELEDKFHIKIPDTDIGKAKTVKDVVDYVMTKTSPAVS